MISNVYIRVCQSGVIHTYCRTVSLFYRCYSFVLIVHQDNQDELLTDLSLPLVLHRWLWTVGVGAPGGNDWLLTDLSLPLATCEARVARTSPRLVR
jgi:hypothetical protein